MLTFLHWIISDASHGIVLIGGNLYLIHYIASYKTEKDLSERIFMVKFLRIHERIKRL